jgi:hypothetical protein
MARKMAAAGLQLLVIDTENKFLSTGARAGGGRGDGGGAGRLTKEWQGCAGATQMPRPSFCPVSTTTPTPPETPPRRASPAPPIVHPRLPPTRFCLLPPNPL